jgi:phosphate transport system protein
VLERTVAVKVLAEHLSDDERFVARFKREIGMSAQEQVAGGHLPVEFAFGLTAVTRSAERIADHCTNVCEQVIYLESGLIVRHRPEGWSEPASPTR